MVARGTHPNSLANLRMFQPGESGNQGRRTGPVIAPAIRKYAEWPYEKLIALAADPELANKLPMKEVIAITSLIKAGKDIPWGDKMREFVAEKLDGTTPKGDTYNDNRVQVLIREVDSRAIQELG